MNFTNKPNLIFLIFACLLYSCQKNEIKEEEENEIDIYAEHVRTSEFQTPEEERLSFVLPPGFEVTLFASEPDITKPINMAFDEKGRLWVTQSSEYPIAAGDGGGKDRITILEDTNGDGKADKIQDFANDLNIPIGIVPIKGGAIGYSIPYIYKFLDTNGDNIADQREILLGEFEHKDTHGMVNNLFRGFDGWIHASHGFSNISTIAGKDGDSIRMVSGNTFRFKMDGSRVEKTTDGRINPFGSDYDEMGYHYSADCHTLPIFQLIWGGNYTQWGKKEPNMGFAPTMMDYALKSTALSGLAYYTDDQFPEEFRNSFYSGDVVTCRISRNTMEFNGSTPTAIKQEDFLVSKDPWFRPVDIKIGPDGAMYIADFYNRIIGHYEVPLNHPGRDRVSGRIWKITYKGNQRPITDWSKANQEELIEGMGNPILQIRMTATDELVDRVGKSAIPQLLELVKDNNTDPVQYIQGIWALFRLDALQEDILESAIRHQDRRVKVHAYKLMANYLQLSDMQLSWAIRDLSDSDPHVQRAAAEMLSRHPNPKSYKALVALHTQVPAYDSHLAYTVLMVLSNHLQKKEIMQMAMKEDWTDEEARLIALVSSDLTFPEAGDFLLAHVESYDEPKEKSIAYTESIARSVDTPRLERLLQWVKKTVESKPDEAYKWAIAADQGLNQKGMKAPSSFANWYRDLATEILENVPNAGTWTDADKQRVIYANGTASRYKMSALSPSIMKLISNKDVDEEVRSSGAKALMQINPAKSAVIIAERIYDGDEETGMRRKFAEAIGTWDDNRARNLLGEAMKNSPTELQETIASVFVKSPQGKSQLMTLIRNGYAPARLLKTRSVEEPLLANISQAQLKDYEELTANLIPISKERVELIASRLADFDPNNSQIDGGLIYENNCSMCHQIDKKGGLIGPQLDGVGNWGKTALATKILDPNRNITENFRTYNISLKNGQIVSGLFRREEGQTVVLANQVGEEFTVSRQEIKEMVPSKYTLMPDNFHTTLSMEEFDGLLVYLLNIK
ncbi:PVC-type heme-binding CxxCH protein [Aquiflexum sp.]|uniref:PVC-type heme-binding CxxCH protein n=1 Tax=Aquiflexum sp. TaxID=1872584 RepID=UPI00359370DB